MPSGINGELQSALRVVRDQRNLLNRINLIWVVQSSSQKYSGSLLTQITCISLAIPAHTQGAFRDRHGRRVGMRWTWVALLTRALTSRTAKSCGPDAPTLASSWRKSDVGPDGGDTLISPMKGTNKPD